MTPADLDDYLTLRDAWITTHPAMRAAKKAVRAAQDEAVDVAQALGAIYASALEPPMPDEGRLSTDVATETRQREAARVERLAALRVKLEQSGVPLPTLTPAVSALDGIDDEIAKLAPLQECEIVLPLDVASYAGDTGGIAVLKGLQYPAAVIGLVIACPPATFEILDFYVGGKSMIYGSLPAELFSASSSAMYFMYFKPTTLQTGCDIYLRFRNFTNAPTPEQIEIKVRVKSRHTREELLEVVS